MALSKGMGLTLWLLGEVKGGGCIAMLKLAPEF